MMRSQTASDASLTEIVRASPRSFTARRIDEPMCPAPMTQSLSTSVASRNCLPLFVAKLAKAIARQATLEL